MNKNTQNLIELEILTLKTCHKSGNLNLIEDINDKYDTKNVIIFKSFKQLYI